MTNLELSGFLPMIPSYIEHNKMNPDTLLSKFHGKISGRSTAAVDRRWVGASSK